MTTSSSFQTTSTKTSCTLLQLSLQAMVTVLTNQLPEQRGAQLLVEPAHPPSRCVQGLQTMLLNLFFRSSRCLILPKRSMVAKAV